MGVTFLCKAATTDEKLNEKGYNLKEILHNYFCDILYIVALSLISRNIFIVLRDFLSSTWLHVRPTGCQILEDLSF